MDKQNRCMSSCRDMTPTGDDINTLLTLFNLGRHTEAENFARSMVERFPRHGFAWKVLGVLLNLQGRNDEALGCMRKAAYLIPGDAEARYNLGNVLKALGRFSEAETSFRRALEIKPDYVEAHSNLGILLMEQVRFSEAEGSFRRALDINKSIVDVHNTLGITLKQQGRFQEAEASFHQALELNPDFVEVHNNLGGILKEQGRLFEAEASFRRALEFNPANAVAWHNLGITLIDQGSLSEAETIFRQTLEINPDYEDAYSSLLFTLNYHPDRSGEEIFSAYRDYDVRFALPHRREWRVHNNCRDMRRRLKVGFVSPDFKNHPVRYFLEPLLANYDHGALEVYAYAELSEEDAVTARYKGYADHWVPTQGLPDATLAECVRTDGIDILVDLAGHTAHNRLGVFARKPAPVSVSWLGYGYSTGLTAVDYYLTDMVNTPPGSEHLFSERPWRLETIGYVYRPAEDMGPIGPLPALERGCITFGTLTRAVRINHRTIQVWSDILKRVKGARLVIDSSNFREADMQDNLAVKFAAHGIDRSRLEIGFHSPPWDVIRGLDIGLDCFPHNSGTTLFESIYLGIPFVTLAGRPSVGRLGSTILEAVGHSELIARSETEYVELAVRLASDLPRLAALRAGLRKEMESGPIMDEARFARKVEAAFREMFRIWGENI